MTKTILRCRARGGRVGGQCSRRAGSRDAVHEEPAKIDVDTEKLNRRPTWAPRSPTPRRARRRPPGRGRVAKAPRDAATPRTAKDWTTPKVEQAIDWLLPRVEHLYKESVKAAAPKVESAADKVSPAIDTAHDKLVDDFLPSWSPR